MTFFSLITTAFSSIFYGVIVTAVIMAILYVVLKSLSKGIVQTSLMIGAIQAKDAADSAEIYLNQLLEDRYGTVGAQDSQRVLDAVTDEYPVIGTFFGVADFSGHDVSDLAKSMHETMIDHLNSYIWHRVWWILGIIVVACVIAVCFEKKGSNRTSTYYSDFERYTDS